MKKIVELFIRLADLVEAEGRAAKQHALHAATVICMLLGATCVALGGVAIVFLGIHQGLIQAGTPAWVSSLIVGLLLLAAAAIVGAVARSSSRTGPSYKERRR